MKYKEKNNFRKRLQGKRQTRKEEGRPVRGERVNPMADPSVTEEPESQWGLPWG